MPYREVTVENHRDALNEIRKFLEGYGDITLPVAYSGTGNGDIYKVAAPPPAVSEVWTLVCTLGGGSGVATFSVTGSVSGAQAAATVGEFYDNGLIEFVIRDGATDFVVSDQFDITVTQGTWTLGTDEWVTNRYCPSPEPLESAGNVDFPEHAFESNNATETGRIGATSGQLVFKFEDATAFVEYSIVSTIANEAPNSWTLEWSDDSENGPWTVEDTQAGQIFTAAETKTYAISSARHIWWRLNISSNNGSADLQFGALRMRQSGQTVDTPSEASLLMQGQGLAGLDEIYIGWKLDEDRFSPYYNWILKGMTNYESADPIESQPGVLPEETRWVCDNNPMDLFMTATGRYLAVTGKIGTDYLNFHMGLLLPYSQPAEYSYPLVVLGNSHVARHFNSTDVRLRQCYDTGEEAGYVRAPGGTWEVVQNFTSSIVTGRNVWPYNSPNGTTWGSTQLDNITEALGGDYELWPCIIMEGDVDPPEGNPSVLYDQIIYGEIEGAYWVSGSNNSPENLVNIGPDEYICFQNVFRTTFRDFYAIKKEA